MDRQADVPKAAERSEAPVSLPIEMWKRPWPRRRPLWRPQSISTAGQRRRLPDVRISVVAQARKILTAGLALRAQLQGRSLLLGSELHRSPEEVIELGR